MTTHTTGYRWKLETAQVAAESFMALWADTCEQAMIAGSIRRKSQLDPSRQGGVSDIEFLALPIWDEVPVAAVAAQLSMFDDAAADGSAASTKRVSRLDKRLEELARQGLIFKDRPNLPQKGLWGEKQKKFWIKVRHNDGIGYIKVDFFIVTPPAQWGSLLMIRTGPKEFEQALMVYINAKTNLRQHDGRLIVRETGLSVPTPTEADYFKVIGLPHVEPHKRTAAWANKWQRMRREPVVYVPPSSTALSGNRFQIGEKSGPDQPLPGEQSASTVIGEQPQPVAQLAPKPSVVNVKTLSTGWQVNPTHVYIGRANKPRKLAGSPLGNPFVIGRDGTREQVIAKYRAWIADQPHLLQMIPHLAEHAEALVCWCAPEACHGDVLVEYIERYRRGEWSPPSRRGALGHNDSEARAAIRQRLDAQAGIVS